MQGTARVRVHTRKRGGKMIDLAYAEQNSSETNTRREVSKGTIGLSLKDDRGKHRRAAL